MVDIAPTFARILITDVIVAREHYTQSDSQAHRRNLIRTTFAAIEGLVWLLREHAHSIGTDLDCLSAMDNLALHELGYSVSENGVLRRTSRYMPLRTSIRYVVRSIQKINPAFHVDFQDGGWADVLISINVRHRITHPKSANDLVIENTELDATSRAFGWMLTVVESGMRVSMTALHAFNDEMRDLLVALKRGDPNALRHYNEALANLDDG